MLIKDNETLLFMGDSITDCERARPVGEGLFGGIGKSYVSLVEGLIASANPAAHIRVINMGTSGNTTADLVARWQSDVLDLKPDWLAIMIGTNDVWRQFDCPLQKERQVLPEQYEKNLVDMIEKTLPTLKGLVLMTPFFMELNREDPMRKRMDEYSAIVKKLAEKYNAVFVDTQAAMDGYLAHNYGGAVGWDRVHPSVIGHFVIARAFLEAVGYRW